MIVIVGLGNPTDKYKGTRHNVGFEAVDKLAADYGISVETYKHKALCGKGMIAGEKVLLMKPMTFMNNSGEAVREAMDFYKFNPEDELVVIYDDISLAVGRLRIRTKGSAGGHNGIKSIIAHTGTEKFKRIRIGIGEKPERMDLADYVLGHFNPEDKKQIEQAAGDVSDAVKIMLEQDINMAMNRYN
ncbi:MAG: aminoacyl-tRNA hydrolase [Lachnospiraceae bacterium]|nr:aminoacyl-tRNA hydrolase [Lachnospiraceae bacterium]